VGGGLVILAGFKALGVLPVDRLLPGRAAPATRTWARLATAFGLGIAFAFGWTPYVGPILTAILFVAGTEEMLGRGLVLLSVYSTGLVLSFLACALAVHVVCTSIAAVRRHRRTVELVAGTMLVVLGSLIFTGRLTLVTEQLTAYLPVF
jgi:cytochrome c-type biogenesis protein